MADNQNDATTATNQTPQHSTLETFEQRLASTTEPQSSSNIPTSAEFLGSGFDVKC
jgi:hypothetical protein